MTEFEIDGILYRTFDHLFAVSRCGEVLRSFKPYTPTNSRKDGYLTLGRQRLLHRVVAICWLENPENKPHVHHINGVKTDNRAVNLEWVTPAEHLAERHLDHVCQLGKYERTPEIREKLRISRLGTKHSEETKSKMSASLKGKKRSFANRALHTEEWKQNMSNTHFRNTKCLIDGVEYRSFADASRVTGIHRFTIRKRCLSENFPNYALIQD